MQRDRPETPEGTVVVAGDAVRAPTAGQNAFDIAFGIVLPGVCLLADPGILRGSFVFGPAMLAGYAAAAYALILPAMVVLAAWLALRKGGLLFAGPLFAAAFGALGIGIVLLPIALPLSIVGIGLLGLVPFGTAFAFFRNGVRAVRTAGKDSAPVLVPVALLLGAATLALPVLAQDSVDRRTNLALEAALSGDSTREADAIARLRPFGWLADATPFVAAMNTSDAAVQERLARVWREATGSDLARMVD